MSEEEIKITVKLKVIEGPNKAEEFIFDHQDMFILGRSKDCSCVVKGDPTFSRHHMLLEINQANVALKDLGSLNGTWINAVCYGKRDKSVAPEDAEPSEAIALYDGAEIKAGRNIMALTIDAPALCVDCGKDIPRSARKAAEFINGTYLCKSCRRQEEERIKKPKPIERKEDVRINVEQRKNAEGDPARVIDELFKDFFGVCIKQNEPQEIQGYRNLQKIGQGGFGAVYKAKRVSDGKIVAVKTMLQTRKPTERQIKQFERELSIACQLHHPNIVATADGGKWKDIYFIEMDYVEGGDVDRLMRSHGGKLTLEQATPIMLDVLEGMAYAHQAEVTVDTKKGKKQYRGVVHRDSKPPNILLGSKGGKHIAIINDFGLAKAFEAAGMTQGSITKTNSFSGTFPYMAREHIIDYRHVKPTTDVFEIAATFFHIITGQVIWPLRRGEDPCKIILESNPRRLKDYLSSAPRTLCDVFDQALEVETNNRFKDGGEFLRAMKQVL